MKYSIILASLLSLAIAAPLDAAADPADGTLMCQRRGFYTECPEGYECKEAHPGKVADDTYCYKKPQVCGRGRPCPSGSVCRPTGNDPLLADDEVCYKLCGGAYPLVDVCGPGMACGLETIAEDPKAAGRCKSDIVGKVNPPAL
jgi:hypothetical protein